MNRHVVVSCSTFNLESAETHAAHGTTMDFAGVAFAASSRSILVMCLEIFSKRFVVASNVNVAAALRRDSWSSTSSWISVVATA